MRDPLEEAKAAAYAQAICVAELDGHLETAAKLREIAREECKGCAGWFGPPVRRD